MRVFVVRHGQSTWNVEHRLQGQVAHVPLTDEGRRQARDAAERLAALVDPARTLLWSSDQLRALDTARIIAGRLGIVPVVSELLREQALGTMEGRLTRELRPEPVPEDQHISEVSWHGSETIEACHARARRLVATLGLAPVTGEDAARTEVAGSMAGNNVLARDRATDVVLVTHGTFAAVLLAVLDGRSHRDVDWDHPLGNGGIAVREPS